jgi:dolichyl-phosphate mannosyltransferase polypeptide 2 regulatory subunit
MGRAPLGGAPLSVRLTSVALLTCSTVAFIYYTVWTLVLPFVDDDQTWLHALFPPKHLAVAVPAAAGSVLCLAAGLAAAYTLITGTSPLPSVTRRE